MCGRVQGPECWLGPCSQVRGQERWYGGPAVLAADSAGGLAMLLMQGRHPENSWSAEAKASRGGLGLCGEQVGGETSKDHYQGGI